MASNYSNTVDSWDTPPYPWLKVDDKIWENPSYSGEAQLKARFLGRRGDESWVITYALDSPERVKAYGETFRSALANWNSIALTEIPAAVEQKLRLTVEWLEVMRGVAKEVEEYALRD